MRPGSGWWTSPWTAFRTVGCQPRPHRCLERSKEVSLAPGERDASLRKELSSKREA